MRWGVAGGLLDSDEHCLELTSESTRLLDFFDGPDGIERFAWRKVGGTVDASRPLALYSVARLVHCFGIAHMLGHSRAGDWAEEGVRLLLDNFAAPGSLGFADAISIDGAKVAKKRSTYGHAFALLAGTTARQAGIVGSGQVIHRATEAIDTLLWEDDAGVAVDAVDPTGRVLEAYRGQNANLHLAEAFLAAYEEDGDRTWLRRAQRIAERLVLRTTTDHDARIPEHYTADWIVDPAYGHDAPLDQFRPFGTMPGHAVEWARLLLNLATYVDDDARLLTRAKGLFANALQDGRTDGTAGLAYTVDYGGHIVSNARMHWVAAEALSAAAWLARSAGEPMYADCYDEFWTEITTHFVDLQGGSWWHELDAHNAPATTTWAGKPDLYHAFQATLTARLTRACGVAAAARDGAIRSTSATNSNTNTNTERQP